MQPVGELSSPLTAPVRCFDALGTERARLAGLSKTCRFGRELRPWGLAPTGGCLLGADDGCKVLYVDAAGTLHLFVNGQTGAHSGGGRWFYLTLSGP